MKLEFQEGGIMKVVLVFGEDDLQKEIEDEEQENGNQPRSSAHFSEDSSESSENYEHPDTLGPRVAVVGEVLENPERDRATPSHNSRLP